MKTAELRNNFLEFFREKNHTIFPSDTLVPDDPTVLFTSAGMNQFKPYFLGERKDFKRIASCQKCLRTGDLENVGKTNYHHTFFEMLGNFSFGDYFKKEAVEFAWEFLTKNLNLKERDLWVSVYEQDDEAYNIWKNHSGVSPEKIVRLGQDSNFWPANASLEGPCGPCSEVFFDRGKNVGCHKDTCGPACACGRFVEVWNLVFTQFNRIGKNKLDSLPQCNIDTGLGLERMAAVLQGKESNFEIDIFEPVVSHVKDILKIKDIDLQIRSLVYAIVDHGRAVTFAIADGVFPSNEDRGYVIRKIIRRALWKSQILGRKSPFLHKLPPVYADILGEVYNELKDKKDIVSQIIFSEEEKFLRTIDEGKIQFEAIVKNLEKQGCNVVDAQTCFRLYDTYGFPAELSREIAHEYNMTIDEDGFSEFLKQQQERSRQSSMFDENIFKKGEGQFSQTSCFQGDEVLKSEGLILRMIKDGHDCDILDSGEQGLIILDNTPFYPEGGGQLTDKGFIVTEEGKFEVERVFKQQSAIVHKGKVVAGKIHPGKVLSAVNQERRRALCRAHTATHLLQAALRQVLGCHVCQQGSLVDDDRLRFDFTHFKALTISQLEKVQDLVNEYIFRADILDKKIISYEQAKQEGALAFFKDKYSQSVRVVSISDYSKELCGGTHLDNTAQVGCFYILSEASISSGIRRIEAVVGLGAYSFSKLCKDNYYCLTEILKCPQGQLRPALEKILDELKSQKEKTLKLEKEMLATETESIFKHKKKAKEINYIVYSLEGKDYSLLLYLIDILRKKMKVGFIFLISNYSGKNIFVCWASPDIIKKGFSVKKFLDVSKEDLALRGGGKDNLVQGVITRKEKDFLKKAEKMVKVFLNESCP